MSTVLIPDNEKALSALAFASSKGVTPEQLQQIAWLYQRVSGAIGANAWSKREEFKGMSPSKIMLAVLASPVLMTEALSQNGKYYATLAKEKAERVSARQFAKALEAGHNIDLDAYPEAFVSLVIAEQKKLKEKLA